MHKILLIVLLGAVVAMASDVALYPAPLDIGFTRNVGESYLSDSRVLARGHDGLLGYNSLGLLGYPRFSNRLFSAYDRVAFNRQAINRFNYDRLRGYPFLGLNPYGLLL